MLTFLEGTHGYPGGNKYKQNYILFDGNGWAFIKSLNTTNHQKNQN